MVLAIPSQYRELLAAFGSLDTIDARLRHRHDAQSWSALERIAHLADALHASAKCAVAILDGDRDRFAPVHVDAPRAGTHATPSRVVLGSLFAAAADLGRAVSRAQPEGRGWQTRTGSRGTSLREVCAYVLHESRHHLRDVEDLLNAFVGAPPPPGTGATWAVRP